MLHIEAGALQSLRLVAMINALDAGDHAFFGRAHLLDGEETLALLIAQGSVGFDIQRILRIAFDHHLAMNTMNAGDDAQGIIFWGITRLTRWISRCRLLPKRSTRLLRLQLV